MILPYGNYRHTGISISQAKGMTEIKTLTASTYLEYAEKVCCSIREIFV